MAKADLHAAKISYDAEMARAQIAESEGRYVEAIEHAMNAWDDLDDMMRYEKRWESQEFESVPCVDLVLHCAPLVLHKESLDKLRALLRSQKRIEKNTFDNLADRLDQACRRLDAAHELWDRLEQSPMAARGKPQRSLSQDINTYRWIETKWATMGMVHASDEGEAPTLRLMTNLDEQVVAKCSRCGTRVQGHKFSFLHDRECPKCHCKASFVIGHTLRESN